MMRSKSTMERFVKAKNSEDSKLSGTLKTSGGGAFKHQKSIGSQAHWERTKSLIFATADHQI